MFIQIESNEINNLPKSHLELLSRKIVTAAQPSLEGYSYDNCQDAFVSHESTGHIVSPAWFNSRQTVEEEGMGMLPLDLVDNSDSGVSDYHVDVLEEILGLTADCLDVLEGTRASLRFVKRKGNTRFEYAAFISHKCGVDVQFRVSTPFPRLGVYSVSDLDQLYLDFDDGADSMPNIKFTDVETNSRYASALEWKFIKTYIEMEKAMAEFRLAKEEEEEQPVLGPGQYTPKAWKPYSIYAGVHDGNCQLCAHTPEEHHYLESSIDADDSNTVKVGTLNWQDVVINPVGAGWNYRDKCFKWFGKDLTTPVKLQRRSNVRNIVSTTVLTVVDDLRCYLRSLQIEGTLLGNSGAVTSRKLSLPIGNDRVMQVQCYPVHPLVSVAVATPRRQRGRSMVTGVYNPRSDTIGIGNKHISVRRTVTNFTPCRYHLAQWVKKGSQSMAGQALTTGLPVANVLVDVELYARLWKVVFQRVMSNKHSLVILEGDTDC